ERQGARVKPENVGPVRTAPEVARQRDPPAILISIDGDNLVTPVWVEAPQRVTRGPGPVPEDLVRRAAEAKVADDRNCTIGRGRSDGLEAIADVAQQQISR